MLALLACALFATAAPAATTVPSKGTDASSIKEILRRLREHSSTSKAGAPRAPQAGAKTPTTTYAPTGGAAAPAGTATTGATATPGGATTPTPKTAAPAVTTPATPAPAPSPAQKRATSAAGHGGGKRLSSAAIAIVVLAALLVLACLAWAIARSRAFEPRWLVTLRHACAEAGFRASATWSEVLDWARLGR